MKSKLVSFVFTLAIVSGFARGSDAPPLTLEQALADARQKSPALERGRAQEGEASWRQFEAFSGHLPKFSVNGTHLLGVKYQVIDINLGAPALFPVILPRTTINLDATLTVFDGLQTIHAYSAARANHEAAIHEVNYAALAVEEEVRLRFYQALAAQALADVADQNQKTLEDHVVKIRSVLSHGEATRFDLLRVQVQLEEAAPEALSAHDNVVLARRALAQSIGTSETPETLAGELPTPSESWLAHDVKGDPSARDDTRALALRAEAAEDLRAAGLGGYLPKLGLFAEKQYYNNTTASLTDPYRDAYSVGVALTWNIFDGGVIARQREAAYAAAQADAAATAAVLKAGNDLELWRRRLNYNVALYSARKRAVESAQESVRLATAGFRAGTRTNTDFLDAELDLFRARAGAVRAQLDSAESLINLELALGRKL